MLIRRLAQPMIASTFIAQGLDAVRHPDKHVDLAKDKVDRVTTAAGLGAISPTQLGLVVRAHGALTVLLGLKVALGKKPRGAATLLALTNAPVVSLYLPESSTEAKDPEVSGPFIARLTALGAILMLATDRGGKPSVGWRINKAAHDAKGSLADRKDALLAN